MHLNVKRIRIPAYALFWQTNVQPILALFKLQLHVGAEQGDGCNLWMFLCTTAQRVDDRLSIRRPTKFDSIKHIALFCEAKILRSVGLGISIVKGAFGHLGRSLAIYFPGSRAVDRIAVDFQP